MLFSSMVSVMIIFSVWLVSGYVHVFILFILPLSVVIVMRGFQHYVSVPP